MKRVCKKTLKIFSWIFLGIFALLTVLTVAQFLFPSSFFNLFGFRLYRISYTRSMEPILKYNDLIVVVKYDFDSLKEGDIITFDGMIKDGKSITVAHKIVEIVVDDGKKYLRTKGENLPLPDLVPVTNDGADDTYRYIGKFSTKSTFLGNFTAFISSKYGLMAILINLFGVTAIIFIKKNQASNNIDAV